MILAKDFERWIAASINTHITINLAGLTGIVQGQQMKGIANHYEISYAGPNYRNIGGVQFVDLRIGILYCRTPAIDANIYSDRKYIGQMVDKLNCNIPVKRLGSETGDDGSDVGCLVLQSRRGGSDVRVTNMDAFDKGVELIHTLVDADYRLSL
jgi:hypothetical protein